MIGIVSRPLSWPVLAAGVWLAALGGALWSLPAEGAAASGQFKVAITLQGQGPGPSASAFCRSQPGGAWGATVTVVCSTGAFVDISSNESGMPWVPMHGGAYRYLLLARFGGQVLGTVDSYIGSGTVTSWRVLHMADLEYLELTVGW